ncbi:CPBP family intramembrane glutamic endopeptidase [Snuella sedimenti]|uniref:CPBP family intramembrane metalloprotease n=1 Tax=Snuella sedimenti TaxID=2798802 RepID=A0A8J7IGJ4_9FLAO|nr:CPBP family intramembrane glutamic endopeptidase [Snuella sedimenti]MBJ6367668.1 CPBP family intramembrane metalloprotease [Snuella sedimenti]
MNSTKAILLTLLLIIITFLVFLGNEFLIQKIELTKIKPDSYRILSPLIVLISSHLTIFYFFWKPRLNIMNALNLSKYNPNIYLYIPIIAIGILLLNKPFMDLTIHLNFLPNMDNLGNTNNKHMLTLVNGIYIILMTPIFEELFFRRFLLEKLLKTNSIYKALFVSSLCFSFVHFITPYNIIPTFIAGLALGFVYIKTRKIGYSILLHILVNGVINIVPISGVSYESLFSDSQYNLTYWLFFIIGCFLTYIGLKKITTHNN